MKTLVLGLGNLLLGDEGVGVHAARAMMRDKTYSETEIMELGSAIIDALPSLEKSQRLIILDAMQAGGDPGTIYRIPIDQCERIPLVASMHGFDIFRAFALAGRETPPRGVVFGVEPAKIGWSLELSPPLTNALPRLLDAVRKEISLN